MKKALLLVGLIMVGCKQQAQEFKYSTPACVQAAPVPVICPTPPQEDTILSNWVAETQPVVVLTQLNLASYTLGPETNSQNAIPCQGNYGNNGQVRGINMDSMRILGSETQGFIQFGHLKYIGETNTDCHNASKEEYSYKVEPNKLTLCLTAYPYCTVYRHP